jgi:hypothetical protein
LSLNFFQIQKIQIPLFLREKKKLKISKDYLIHFIAKNSFSHLFGDCGVNGVGVGLHFSQEVKEAFLTFLVTADGTALVYGCT